MFPSKGSPSRPQCAGGARANGGGDQRGGGAALRSPGIGEVQPDNHAAVLKIWSNRYRDLGRTRTQVVCRLHALLGELIPGGTSRHRSPSASSRCRTARPAASASPPVSSPSEAAVSAMPASRPPRSSVLTRATSRRRCRPA
jgi:hypothetical protein